MSYKIKDKLVYNEEGYVVSILTDIATDEDIRIIQLGSEIIPVAENFIANVRSGKFKPKSEVKQFEFLLEKYK